MKSPIILTLGCLLASALCSHAQDVAPAVATGDAVAAPLTAAQVLEAGAKRYAGLYQLQATCSIIINGEVAVEGQAPQQFVSSANSKVSFCQWPNPEGFVR